MSLSPPHLDTSLTYPSPPKIRDLIFLFISSLLLFGHTVFPLAISAAKPDLIAFFVVYILTTFLCAGSIYNLGIMIYLARKRVGDLFGHKKDEGEGPLLGEEEGGDREVEGQREDDEGEGENEGRMSRFAPSNRMQAPGKSSWWIKVTGRGREGGSIRGRCTRFAVLMALDVIAAFTAVFEVLLFWRLTFYRLPGGWAIVGFWTGLMVYLMHVLQQGLLALTLAAVFVPTLRLLRCAHEGRVEKVEWLVGKVLGGEVERRVMI